MVVPEGRTSGAKLMARSLTGSTFNVAELDRAETVAVIVMGVATSTAAVSTPKVTRLSPGANDITSCTAA